MSYVRQRRLGAARYLGKQLRLVFKLVVVPFLCVACLSVLALYFLGGTDLLRFATAQLFTWGGLRRLLIVVGGLSLLTWIRHVGWYSYEPPPMWFRGSVWVNVLEAAILLGLIALGAWAVPRFTTALPR
jgi:hypothetical protein